MSFPRRRLVWVFSAVAIAAAIASAMPGCSSRSSGLELASGCTLNSDCSSPLVCIYSLCHQECAASRDCPNGEACVETSAGYGICQLPAEANCSPTELCNGGLVCGQDDKCRAPCVTANNCLMGQQCTQSICYDPGELDGGGSSGSGSSGGGSGGSSGSSGGGDGSASEGGNSCPSAQTQFGAVAQGDTNAGFNSGLGIRTATQLLVFDGYSGPDPVGDSGMVNYVFAQAFDPVSGASQGPAAPLFPGIPGGNFVIEAAAVAPTGEIALLYYANSGQLWVAFLTDDPDAGAGTAGLHVAKSFQLETTLQSQPQAIWSVASKAFVFSWKYDSGDGPMKVVKYLPNGNTAGGGTDPVPTENPSANVSTQTNTAIVGASNDLFAVAYTEYSAQLPEVTVLDPQGNEVGGPFVVSGGTSNWVTAAGTSAGFLVFFDRGGMGTGEVLVPVLADGGVPATTTPDGGDAGLGGFAFTGTKDAVYARSVNDDVGGVGGVGLALLYEDGVSFAYVSADGVAHVGPSSLISHTYDANGDYIHLNNVGGSFGVSLYSTTTRSTQVMASGCTP